MLRVFFDVPAEFNCLRKTMQSVPSLQIFLTTSAMVPPRESPHDSAFQNHLQCSFGPREDSLVEQSSGNHCDIVSTSDITLQAIFHWIEFFQGLRKRPVSQYYHVETWGSGFGWVITSIKIVVITPRDVLQ